MDPFILRDLAVDTLAVLEDVTVTTDEDGPSIRGDGLIDRTVVVTVSTPAGSDRRAAGGSVNRTYGVSALVATTSRDECLWLAQRVTELWTDLTPGNPHGSLTDASFTGEPVREPDTSASLWSRRLDFTITTKRSTP